ncbi:acyl-CoA thioester hydrolase [Mucilaginibacter yixingensis]|uniref:Acyl-CoA thioester hydrolase n=1 Tax=Mucilaginibacter yixingensis TaxID=1295612 RepID=A0A2T5J694_9SPHI|nr:thioesterase family protein [Mucilaginibacter yixingensis]PTQ93991.1 acyl-CoA thioester hydrolase [Mucilaginibacter yixingensis]
MSYSKEYIVKSEHIDVQGIMDGLYYPFYMEWCRHAYIKDELGFDFEEEARNGVNMVLSTYTIDFVRSLKKDDLMIVTCELYADGKQLPKIHFKQSILVNGKIMAKAVFSGTCVKSSGGRPYLPETLNDKLAAAPVL